MTSIDFLQTMTEEEQFQLGAKYVLEAMRGGDFQETLMAVFKTLTDIAYNRGYDNAEYDALHADDWRDG